jgi:hypothetical protein
MPRIIVITQPIHTPRAAEVLLDEDVYSVQPIHTPGAAEVVFDEDVYSVHLSTRHAAGQLVERLSWAVRDAEASEAAGLQLSR